MSRRSKQRTVNSQVKSQLTLQTHRQWLISDILQKARDLTPEEIQSLLHFVESLRKH